MKNKLIWIGSALVLLVFAALALSIAVSRPQFADRLDETTVGDTAIALPQEALSFARYRDQGRLRLLLVTRYQAGVVSGVDLSRRLGRDVADPLALFRELGYEALAQAAQDSTLVTVPVAALELPFDGQAQNIGIGANYREHARESGIEEQPFIFAKLAQPTRHDSAVARAPSVLLDYEAELGLVALEDIAAPGTQPAYMGLVLCNELTDRWTLVRHLQQKSEMGTTGFVEGKSREGFAVLGSLLVIPRDLDSFYRKIELRLHLNGRLRQRELAGSMVWTPQQILSEIFRRADWDFQYYEATVPLLGEGKKIRAGTVIFSGTPSGVIFKRTNLWNPWVYLRPGDEVVIQGSALGSIRNRIVD